MKLTALFSAIAAIVTSHRRADTTESLTPKQLRALLEEEGYAWTDEDWKTKGRACVRGEAERLFVRFPYSRPAARAVADALLFRT